MIGEYLSQLFQYTKEDIDLAARILQHRDRPKANREHDQIYMLVGSQLQQARIIGHYLEKKRVVFMGDGDCMSLLVAFLSEKTGLVPRPRHITVLDFDKRLLSFIESMREECGWHEDTFECVLYNVRDPSPATLAQRGDVFYTNPPYGFYNEGFSNKVFLARAMELCSSSSRGIAILPYDSEAAKSAAAMTQTQRFMTDCGYIVSEMVLGQHNYDLDDRRGLRSGTVVFDRIEDRSNPFKGRRLSDDELRNFYGRRDRGMPQYIGADGNPVF